MSSRALAALLSAALALAPAAQPASLLAQTVRSQTGSQGSASGQAGAALGPNAVGAGPSPLQLQAPSLAGSLPIAPAPVQPAGALGELRQVGAGSEGEAPEVPAGAPASIDAFVARAEELFFKGRLAPGRHGAVLSGPRKLRPDGLPTEEEMRNEMARSPLTNPERERAVVELFRQAGAGEGEIVLQDAGRDRHNIVVVKRGRTDRVIVVGGHHDKVSRGAGTIDNWTGATLVTNLYQAMRDLDTEATFVFIAFAREEEGLVGSRFWVESLAEEQRKKIDAMVNLDTLAVNGTYSWKNNSTRSLLDLVRLVAERERLDLTEATLWGGDADSSSFKRVGIPAMTLFGASADVIFDIIHSERDTMAYFSLPHYKNAYLVALALLKALDARPLRTPSPN